MPEPVCWETVRLAARGDPGARKRLVEDTLDDLWSLAMRLTRNPDEADEVVQETYARVLAALPHLVPAGRFEGYLARAATSVVLGRWRRRRLQTELAEHLASPAAPEPWQSVAGQEDQQRRLAAVWAAIGRLDPLPRAAMLLYYAQDQSCESIAEILDVPANTIKTWLHRSRRQVRQDAERMLAGEPALGPSRGSVS